MARRVLLALVLAVALAAFLVEGVLRLVRHFWTFPMPALAALPLGLPVRHLVNNPETVLRRAHLRPGSRVLEVGPGTGFYTPGISRHLGAGGCLVCLELKRPLARRLLRKVQRRGLGNAGVCMGDALLLPFRAGTFDQVLLIGVLGEFPDRVRAFREARRVLRPGGVVSVTEHFQDPDYPRRSTVQRWAREAGLRQVGREGDFLCYTLHFRADGT
ncbi:MAG: class I SAM-dependent methyltransferase [Anaerolineae bacterium]|nr:class I SAM-dependent methyltransferase [Anaerolineae bacterium]